MASQSTKQSFGSTPREVSRRNFLAAGGKAAAASALAGMTLPRAYAAEDSTIHLAVIGCGGRGSGAVQNAFDPPNGQVKLVAMADLFDSRLKNSHDAMSKKATKQVDVPPERQFIGFDAYKKAIDCLRPGDVAMLTAYCGFRATHLEYAIRKGVNVFMEKPFAVDPLGVRRIIKLGEEAEKKNLKIGCGLMCRHSSARKALIQKIRDGALGDVIVSKATRMGPFRHLGRKPENENEVLWQIRNRIHVFWTGGGVFHDFSIHHVDEVCWLKDAWPVSAQGFGGRIPNSDDCGQNLDAYSVEYTFADGTKALVYARYAEGTDAAFDTFLHGSKCAAQFSGQTHAPTVAIYKDQRISDDNIAWKPDPERISPYNAEWHVLIDAIRNDKKHNEAKRGAYSDLAFLMGRAAVHSGKTITWDQAMASHFTICKDIDTLNENSAPPIRADAQGRLPAPIPGLWSEI